VTVPVWSTVATASFADVHVNDVSSAAVEEAWRFAVAPTSTVTDGGVTVITAGLHPVIPKANTTALTRAPPPRQNVNLPRPAVQIFLTKPRRLVAKAFFSDMVRTFPTASLQHSAFDAARHHLCSGGKHEPHPQERLTTPDAWEFRMIRKKTTRTAH
jgi:hypothetical protein